MNYLPTAMQIKSTLPEFVVKDVSIEGLYGNQDVDSMIFRYTVKVNAQTSIDDILVIIIEKAQKAGWSLIEKRTNFLNFTRFRPRGKYFSAEDVRIIVIQKNLKVYVSWVQADTEKSVSRFEDTNEWNFAKRVIWPKLESYVAQEK
jgi:hypothetical protein